MADGGYFENSGLSTVLDMIHTLNLPDQQRVHLIVIRIGTVDEKTPDSRLRQSGLWLGETLSPLRTVMNTRRARGEIAREQTKRLLTALGNRMETSYYELLLDVEEKKIPLGWLLSRASRANIEEQVTRRRLPGEKDEFGKPKKIFNGDTIDEIIGFLKSPEASRNQAKQFLLPKAAL